MTVQTTAPPRLLSPNFARHALAAIVLGLYVAVAVVYGANIKGGLDPSGSPLFYDFSAFYQAADLAKSGHADQAYDDKTMIAAEQRAFPGTTRRLPWNYPPSFQLMLTPLALLPYALAWAVWSAGLYAAYAALSWALARRERLWLLLFPGAAMNVLLGQNGVLTLALLGGGAWLIRRRPILAGVLLGLATYKPQFALLVPLVLIGGREWRALAASAASAIGVAAVSLAAFGAGPWLAFVHKALAPEAVVGGSTSDWRTIPNLHVLARDLGADPHLASALQWGLAAVAAAFAIWVWAASRDGRMRAAALCLGALMVAPYLRVYDLALFAPAIALLLEPAEGEAALSDRLLAAVAWLTPLILLFGPRWLHLGPPVMVALMATLAWRASRNGAENPVNSAFPLTWRPRWLCSAPPNSAPLRDQ